MLLSILSEINEIDRESVTGGSGAGFQFYPRSTNSRLLRARAGYTVLSILSEINTNELPVVKDQSYGFLSILSEINPTSYTT